MGPGCVPGEVERENCTGPYVEDRMYSMISEKYPSPGEKPDCQHVTHSPAKEGE